MFVKEKLTDFDWRHTHIRDSMIVEKYFALQPTNYFYVNIIINKQHANIRTFCDNSNLNKQSNRLNIKNARCQP